MSIQLTDIDEDDDISPAVERSRIGCFIMSENESWSAESSPLNQSEVGQGPLDVLSREAIWISNLEFNELRMLQGANNGLKLRVGNWMRIGLDDMPREWGIETYGSKSSSAMISTILDRVYGVSIEAILGSGVHHYKTDADLVSMIEKSPSLATGFRKAFAKEIEKTTPADPRVKKKISEGVIYGISKVGETHEKDGEILIQCRIPRLTHSLRVSSREVPCAGKWQKANIDGNQPIEAILDQLVDLNLPVIITANVKEKQGMSSDYLSLWVRPNTKAIKRISYTLEEVVILSKYFSFEDYSVVVGPGWKKSITGSVISSLVSNCGGRDVASANWSVNAAAENILCSGFRKIDGSDALPPESLWITVYDRIDMLKPIEALSDLGATIVKAYAGGITVKAMRDPEMLMMIANCLWENGLVMPIGTVKELMAMGVHVPYDSDGFGGAPEDLILSQLTHRGQRNAIWAIDEFVEAPPAMRREAFLSLFGQG